jgi:hypothetical protein
LIETLLAREVDTIFGLPGDGINGIIEALRTRQDKVKFIQVRRGVGRTHGLCLCEVDRQAWRMPGDLRASWNTSAQWPL